MGGHAAVAGFDIWPIGMGRRTGADSAAVWSIRLFSALKRSPVQIVHTHNAYHGVVGRIIARSGGSPRCGSDHSQLVLSQPP